MTDSPSVPCQSKSFDELETRPTEVKRSQLEDTVGASSTALALNRSGGGRRREW